MKKIGLYILEFVICFSVIFQYYGGYITPLKFLAFSIFILGICLITYFINRISEEKITLKFILVAILFGVMFIFLNPILHGTDEVAHFYKVYSIFNKIDSVTEDNVHYDLVPESMSKSSMFLKDVNKLIHVNLQDEPIVKSQYFLGTRLYSALSYIPYLLPMFIFTRVIHLNFYFLVILGRIFAFIFWLIISVHTINIMPKRKEFMAFLCLMPIVLSSVTIFSADLMTNSMIFLFIAYWYRLYLEKRQITKKEILIISILGIFTACAKIVYALIFLLMLILPEECFGNKRKKIIDICVIIFIVILAVVINMFCVGGDLGTVYPKMKDQKEYIFSNMVHFIKILIVSIWSEIGGVLRFATNGDTGMSQMAISLQDLFSYMYLVILVVSLKLDESEIKVTKKNILLYIFIIAAIICIMYISLYVQFTAVQGGIGYNRVLGFQPRYFVPISAMLILFNNKKKLKVDKSYLWTGTIFVNMMAIVKLILVFV